MWPRTRTSRSRKNPAWPMGSTAGTWGCPENSRGARVHRRVRRGRSEDQPLPKSFQPAMSRQASRRLPVLRNARGVVPLTIEFLLLAFWVVLFAIAFVQMHAVAVGSWDAYTGAWNDGRRQSLDGATEPYREYAGRDEQDVATFPWFRRSLGAPLTVRRAIAVPGGSNYQSYLNRNNWNPPYDEFPAPAPAGLLQAELRDR